MRINSPSGTRNFPTDRNPARVSLGVARTDAGLVNVTVLSYTVPVGRRALLTMGATVVVTVAFAAGQDSLLAVSLPGMGTQAPQLYIATTAPIQTRDGVVVTDIFAAAGDIVSWLLVQAAGVGTTHTSAAIIGTEYDA